MITNNTSQYGLFRIAVCTPENKVADVEFNTGKICEAINSCGNENVQLAVFPELCITAYSCGDLFYQHSLREHALSALEAVKSSCVEAKVAAIVGLPMYCSGNLYNVAVLIGADGVLSGVVPKTYLPSTNEFYESRWFRRGDFNIQKHINIGDSLVPFGCDLIFRAVGQENCMLAIEICEDLWAVNPPSGNLALAGASVIVNPSASNETLGKKDYRSSLVMQQSARCIAAYAYAGAGPGESSTDVVYSGHSLIAENGVILEETKRFSFETEIAIADVDLDKLAHDRIKNSSFAQALLPLTLRTEPFRINQWVASKPRRVIDKHPFVPKLRDKRTEHCEEIFAIQSTGLAKRIRHTKAESLIIGLSGGLDSTLAALVSVRALAILGRKSSQLIAVTMPGFGTTGRTFKNAENLARLLGLTLRNIPIDKAVLQHFKDIDHAADSHDVTYENSQARERTQILMNIANQMNGFVVGTGDLSENALGWCTFNGDHMSMYNVNASVPKTLVRYLIEWCANEQPVVSETLMDICATPISPELLPKDEEGQIKQKTEDAIGPYELHDFFLFHMIRNGFSELKTRYYAEVAFEGLYSSKEIEVWYGVFRRRFFSQQFKRSSMPDGPKVGSVSLSPRGDWKMPSDCSVTFKH